MWRIKEQGNKTKTKIVTNESNRNVRVRGNLSILHTRVRQDKCNRVANITHMKKNMFRIIRTKKKNHIQNALFRILWTKQQSCLQYPVFSTLNQTEWLFSILCLQCPIHNAAEYSTKKKLNYTFMSVTSINIINKIEYSFKYKSN